LDRNFDDLAHRFRRNVYDQLKGDIRLAVLRRDLAESVPYLAGLAGEKAVVESARILDAGGGQGQLAVMLAALGHEVDLCDISGEMLALARQVAAESGVSGLSLHHESIQDFIDRQVAGYDLVVCHAVLEWVAEPETLLARLVRVLKPGGHLSLTFYNINSIKMKNLLRANFGKVLAGRFTGHRGSLTPTHPRETTQVMAWMKEFELELLCHSGIRCFHDYILDQGLRTSRADQQLELELRLSREEPFRSLGRYIHLLYRKDYR